jgi:hypothetical protein
MADSKRQQIIEAIDTRLKTILTTGGYHSNIGQHVFEWKTSPFSDEQEPGVTYRDVSNNREAEGAVNKFRWRLTVEIEVVSQTTAETMRLMIADVLKAVGVDHTWGALAQRSGQPDTEMIVEQTDKIVTGAKITLPITYDAPLWED